MASTPRNRWRFNDLPYARAHVRSIDIHSRCLDYPLSADSPRQSDKRKRWLGSESYLKIIRTWVERIQRFLPLDKAEEFTFREILSPVKVTELSAQEDYSYVEWRLTNLICKVHMFLQSLSRGSGPGIACSVSGEDKPPSKSRVSNFGECSGETICLRIHT
ncbi:hypothetical protein Bbelb_042120 [Branchiostoma belcheri]|nr:hypothetical protein Bbelb_042120 [Branchiostoma belcheri]